MNLRAQPDFRPSFARRFRRTIQISLSAALMSSLAIMPADACPVCWGASDDPLVKGTSAGVIVLGVLVYTLLLGFVGFGILFFIRSRRLARGTAVNTAKQN